MSWGLPALAISENAPAPCLAPCRSPVPWLRVVGLGGRRGCVEGPAVILEGSASGPALLLGVQQMLLQTVGEGVGSGECFL